MTMTFRDIGVIVYGGAVAGTEWWDNKRIEEGKIAKNELWKKASFYTYLGIGVPSLLISAFGWWRRAEPWAETISHGFLYDFPRFIIGVVQSMGGTQAKRRSGSEAVKEAEKILEKKSKVAGLLASGRAAERSYQLEFEPVAPYAF